MEHRKRTHREKCKDALLRKCRFNQLSCYLNHEGEKEAETAMESGEFEVRQDFRTGNLDPQPPGSMKQQQDNTKHVLQQIVSLIQTLLN